MKIAMHPFQFGRLTALSTVLAAAALTVSLFVPRAAAAAGGIKLGIIPYDAPSKLQEQYGPFAAYLSAKIRQPVKVFVAQDYVGVAQALQADQIDVAYLNPLSYALFVDRLGRTPEHLIPLAMPDVHGSLYYYGAIFVRKDSHIANISQLRGKRFAFAEPTSTSGYLYPFQYLLRHGINPKHDLGQQIFAGTPAVVPAVLNGSVDAGAVFEEGLTMFGRGRQKELTVLARVGPIANGMLVARGNLDRATLKQLQSAMAAINTDPAAKVALSKLEVSKWEKPNDKVFDPVRQAAHILNLNLQSLVPHH